MAIFHMRAQVISRAAGRSAIAAAAYRAGERLRDERTGQMHDYSRKAHVEHREILAPENAPAWMLNRAALWSAVEAAEKRKDAQLAREVHFALPRELDAGQRVELIRDFSQREFVARGMIADIAIHNPSGRDGGEQPHAHVMLTTRVLTGDGFGPKERVWNDKALYESWRERWSDHVNRSLERIGSGERIDHRSFAERGIDREPEPKLGPKAARLERQEQRAAANENRPAAAVTDRGREWRAVQERNRRREQLRARFRVVTREIAHIAERILAEARARLDEARARFDRAAAVIREWVGRERRGSEPEKASCMERTPDRSKADVLSARTAPTERDRLLGRDMTREPDRDLAQSAPTRDALLGRSNKASKPGRGRDRAVLPVKETPPEAWDKSRKKDIGDLLGRGLSNMREAPRGIDRSKGNGDRER